MNVVRSARPEDLERVREVHVASISHLAASVYEPHAVEKWLRVLTLDAYRRLLSALFVAEVDGQIVGLGVADTEQGIVSAVYVDPRHTQIGVGSVLLAEAEIRLADAGNTVARLNATLNAIGFYQRRGYSMGGPVTNILPDGTALPAELMTKSLDHISR